VQSDEWAVYIELMFGGLIQRCGIGIPSEEGCIGAVRGGGVMIKNLLKDPVEITSAVLFGLKEDGKWTCIVTFRKCPAGILSRAVFCEVDALLYPQADASGQSVLDGD